MRIIKVKIEFVETPEEESLHLKVQHLDDSTMQFINMMKLKDSFLFAQKDEKNYRVYLKDIYYFEAVEKKVFVYTKQNVYEIKEKLYQIEEKYEDLDFLRVSKSVIVNINKIEAIYPALSGRFEVELYNGERLRISRSYVSDLKIKLGMESGS